MSNGLPKNTLPATKVEYFAIAIENTENVERGTTVKLRNADEAYRVYEYGYHYFPIAFNMHFDTEIVKCVVVKSETKYSLL